MKKAYSLPADSEGNPAGKLVDEPEPVNLNQVHQNQVHQT
jgi:hypothetical protein